MLYLQYLARVTDVDIQTKMNKFPIILANLASHRESLQKYLLFEKYALQAPELGLLPYIDGFFSRYRQI